MLTAEQFKKLRLILREEEIPFFTPEELEAYYQDNNQDLNATIYHCCIVKAENTSVQLSGLSVSDSSRYFLRLAQRYRPSNSGILGGGS